MIDDRRKGRRHAEHERGKKHWNGFFEKMKHGKSVRIKYPVIDGAAGTRPARDRCLRLAFHAVDLWRRKREESGNCVSAAPVFACLVEGHSGRQTRPLN
jgi:hypothetical protein